MVMHGPFKHLRYGVLPVVLINMNPLRHHARCLCTVETNPPHLVCRRGRGGGIGSGMGPQACCLAIQTAASLVNVTPVVLWVIGESKSLDVSLGYIGSDKLSSRGWGSFVQVYLHFWTPSILGLILNANNSKI